MLFKGGQGMSFIDELKVLINKHSLENGSDTPNFILANFIAESIKAFDVSVVEREKWYGREKSIRFDKG